MTDRTSWVGHESGLYNVEGHKSGVKKDDDTLGLKDHDTYFGEGTKY